MSRKNSAAVGSLPKVRTPSVRDVSIFYEVRVAGRTQADVARQFNMTQPRVSQICKRLASWRADVPPDQSGDLAAAQYRRLTHWQWRERTEMMFSDARNDYLRSRGDHVTVKEGPRGKETTTRPPRADIRALEQCRRLNNDLLKHADQPPPPGAEPAIPQEVQTGLEILRMVESGQWTIDQADHEAVEHQRARKLPIPRLWAKYDGDPVKDAETYEPITPRELEVPPVVRWSSGRFYVNEGCYAVYVPRAGGRHRERLAAEKARERRHMNVEPAAEGPSWDDDNPPAPTASDQEYGNAARGAAARDDWTPVDLVAENLTPEHGGPEEEAEGRTLAGSSPSGPGCGRSNAYGSSPERGQDARGPRQRAPDLRWEARTARYARVGFDYVVHPDLAAKITQNRAEKLRKRLQKAKPGPEPEPGLNRLLTEASRICGPPGAEFSFPAGNGGFRS
jgi:hypothetical protein